MTYKSNTFQDGGWAWVVLVSTFFAHFIIFGTGMSLTVFFSVFMEYFEKTRSETAWINSIHSSVFFFSGLVSSFLIERYGWRIIIIFGALLSSIGLFCSYFAQSTFQLYLTIGFLTGFGYGLVHISSIVSLGSYFNERRSFAQSFSLTGGTLGLLLMPIFTSSLLRNFSWHQVLLFLASLSLQLFIVGCLIRPIEFEEKNIIPSKESFIKKLVSQRKLFTKKMFLFLAFTSSWMASIFITLQLFFDFIIADRDLTMPQASFTFSCIMFGTLLGNLSSTLLSFIKIFNVRYAFLAANTIQAIFTPFFLLSKNYSYLCLICFLFGVPYGTKTALSSMICIDIFGVQNLSFIYGYTMLISGFAILIAPPFGGWLVDLTGGYKSSFIAATILSFFASFLLLWIILVKAVPTKEVEPHEFKKAEIEEPIVRDA